MASDEARPSCWRMDAIVGDFISAVSCMPSRVGSILTGGIGAGALPRSWLLRLSVLGFFFLAGDFGSDDVRDELVADMKDELAALSIGVGRALRIR